MSLKQCFWPKNKTKQQTKKHQTNFTTLLPGLLHEKNVAFVKRLFLNIQWIHWKEKYQNEYWCVKYTWYGFRFGYQWQKISSDIKYTSHFKKANQWIYS